MSATPDIPAELKDRIFDAVNAELLESGIDRFSIDGVAGRAEVDRNVILSRWHDRRVLLMDVLLARTSAEEWNPDTGSLYSDLQAMSSLAMEISRTATGRALFRRVLPGGEDVDLAEVGSDLWTARFKNAAQVLQRAAERGQLRDGVIPEEAIRMFAAAFYYDVVFTDSPVRPEYGDQVLDIFLHGILGAAGRDRPWTGVETLLRQGEPGGSAAADQAVEAARHAVVLMRVWADALLDPVVLYEAVRDERGGIVDFVCRDLNRATCEEVGLSRTELLGRRLLETLPDFASSGLMERYVACAENGTPFVLNNFSYMHFDQQRHLDIRATSAGAELITVTWRDVSDRVESERREERYRKLMDFSAIPTALATPDGRLVEVNQAMATMLGYDMDTLLSMTWQELTTPEAIEDDLAGAADLLSARRDTYRTITEYLRADGHRIPADLSVSCIRRPDGEVEHLIAQMIDIGSYGRDGSTGLG